MMKKSIILIGLICAVSSLRAQYTVANFGTPSSLDWELPNIERADKIPLFALKTNLLYDALLTPNIALELPIDGYWSVVGRWMFAWWEDSKHQRCYENLSGEVEARYWFQHHTPEHPMDGWFVGAYINAGYYDVERRARGAQGNMWGMGASGGFTHPLKNPALRMEYSAGLGFINTNYNKYNEVEDCQGDEQLLRYKRGHYRWWGVTKVEVSLVWMLYGIKRDRR